MKLKYYGTAAAEGIPALFCECEVCKRARKTRGKNIQTRHQAIVDDKLLLDFGPDTYFHVINHNLPLQKVHHVLITHDHDDHFYLGDVIYRGKGYASKVDGGVTTFYGSQPVFNKVDNLVKTRDIADRIAAVLLEPYKEYKIDEYLVTPVKAVHSPVTGPYNYLIKKDNKTMLYAHDTGFPMEETISFLAKYCKQPLNLLSMDITQAKVKGYSGSHLCIETFLETLKIFKEKKIVDENTIVIASHLSHNGLVTRNELAKEMKKYGVKTSYDGMEIKF